MAEPRFAPGRTLVYLVGPPAVGKMTVGQEIAARTGMRLFHNHMTIELVLRFFEFGSPPFERLVEEFRQRPMEEVAGSDLPGLIFTFVWAFDLPEEQVALERYARPFRQRGGRVLFVELHASQEERLRRNQGASRLAEKPSKRDLTASRRNLLEMDAQYHLNSRGQFDDRADYFRIDNTRLTAEQVAQRVIDHFALPVIANSSEAAGC
jgi:AAA domain